MPHLLKILAILVLLNFSSLAYAGISASERAALLDLYASTHGASWIKNTNWNGAAGTECTWLGVTCKSGWSECAGDTCGDVQSNVIEI